MYDGINRIKQLESNQFAKFKFKNLKLPKHLQMNFCARTNFPLNLFMNIHRHAGICSTLKQINGTTIIDKPRQKIIITKIIPIDQ